MQSSLPKKWMFPPNSSTLPENKAPQFHQPEMVDQSTHGKYDLQKKYQCLTPSIGGGQVQTGL